MEQKRCGEAQPAAGGVTMCSAAEDCLSRWSLARSCLGCRALGPQHAPPKVSAASTSSRVSRWAAAHAVTAE